MRFALGVEYDGSDFSGWQRLNRPGEPERRGEPTLQASVEEALSFVAGHPVEVVCAGRTDAGVHAACQVVHFDSSAARAPRGWVLGATTRLPESICALWCVPVADGFHARFSARARRYRYRILNRAVRPALQRQYLSWERRPLDAEAMHRAAQALAGENDFSAFRTVHCQAPHARRDLQHIAVARHGDIVEVEVQANAFLHRHGLRNIVGSLLPVGRGERPDAGIAPNCWQDGTGRIAGPTAPPDGALLIVAALPGAEFCLPVEVTLLSGSISTCPRSGSFTGRG